MNEGLHMSERGLALVKSFESCLKRAPGGFTTYICPAGKLTIGWGHTNAAGRKFKAGDIWTQGECDAALAEDMRAAERDVRRLVKVDLTQGQFDALVSFDFNCGPTNLQRSTLLRKVNRKDFDGAAAEFGKWINGDGKPLNGLIRRRKAEAVLFSTGDHAGVHAEYRTTPEAHELCPQQVDVPAGEPKLMRTSKIGNAQIAVGAGAAVEAAAKARDALDQANSLKQGAEDLGLLDMIEHVAAQPTFWIAVATIVLCGCVWYWRRQHAEVGV